MAAVGPIRDMIQAAVDALTGRYDARLDALEQRVTALESASGAAAARKAAARRNVSSVQAQAGVAEVKGEAPAP